MAATEPLLLGKGRQPSQVELPALLSAKYFPALLSLDSNIMGVLCALLASMTAMESVIYLCTWQCWVGNELRASSLLGKDATSSCHICDCYSR